MKSYYVVKCDPKFLLNLILEKLKNHRTFSKTFFQNLLKKIVFEELSDEEADKILAKLINLGYLTTNSTEEIYVLLTVINPQIHS